MVAGYTVLSGELLQGVRGDLVASFHLDTETFLALGEMQHAVERRVRAQAPEHCRDMNNFCLTEWRGGWGGDGSGRWEADIFGMRGPAWHKVGRALITARVRGHADSSLRPQH